MLVRTALVVLAGTAMAFAAESVSVKPTGIVETRVREIVKSSTLGMLPSSLTVKVRVEGDAVTGASTYGKVKFTEAVDDVGTDLRPKKEAGLFGLGGDDEGFTKINRFMEDDKAPQAKGFDMELYLGIPSRKATQIKALRGEFQVMAGGEEKTVSVTKLKSLMGKSIEDPALKAAGLTIKVLDPEKQGEGANTLALELKGNINAMKKGEILDAAGKSFSDGNFSMGSESEQTTTYSLSRPLDDAMMLKLHLVVGQKAVTVPVDLSDLALP